MSDHETIEGLHQRAAENYLQGEFREALESWRELLNLDPEDDRAIEGVRLCELLVQQSADNDLPPRTEAPIIQPTAPAPGEGSDVDFDEIANMLEDPSALADESKTENDPGWDFSAFEDAAPAVEGLDMADLPSLDAGPPDAGEGEAFDLPALDLGPASQEPAAEVQTRIADLLSQASTSYDAGDLEGAMNLLDRVFVLDEQNPVALALAEAFRADIQERDEPKAGDGPLADAVAEENLEALGLAAPATSTDDDPAPLVATPPELGTSDGELSAFDDTDLPEADIEAATETLAAKPTSGKRKPLLLGAGVVVALALAAFLGLRMRGSSDSDAADAPRIRPVESAPAAEILEPSPEPDASAVATPVDPVVPAPAADLPSALARAQAAFKAGEFSKAVVAFNEALQIEPGNPAAQRGLANAAAAYQEQRDFTTKLNSATDAFARSDYREALRVFYRLPGTEGVPRFDSFKANSWYNLGVGALKSGSCNDAKSHLKEAGALRSGDAGILAASRLAASCARSASTPTWYGEVERLQLRGLED